MYVCNQKNYDTEFLIILLRPIKFTSTQEKLFKASFCGQLSVDIKKGNKIKTDIILIFLYMIFQHG